MNLLSVTFVKKKCTNVLRVLSYMCNADLYTYRYIVLLHTEMKIHVILLFISVISFLK